MPEPITVDTILGYLQRAIEEKLPVAPSVWIDAAQKLVVLMGAEHDTLCELEQEVSTIKLAYLEADPKHNVSAAKSKVQASDAYKKMRKQQLLCERLEEFVRVSKLRGRLMDSEMRSN